MLVRITLVLEVLSIIFGIYRVYGEKIKVEIHNVLLCISMLIVLELVNYHSLHPIYTNLNLLFVLIFCVFKFKEGLIHSTVSSGLVFAIVTIIQFMSGIVIAFIPNITSDIRSFFANIISSCIIIFVLPYCKLNKLKSGLLRKNWIVYLSIIFITFVLVIMLFQRKGQGAINVESFIFVIPAIAIIFLVITLWDRTIDSEKKLKAEMNSMLTMQDDYSNLIDKVRLNQHSLKSHLTAMFSSYYTYKTYEQFLNAQSDYYNILKQESRYDKLITINNQILAGFLYGKMQEFENSGIEIQYDVATEIKNSKIPNYYLVEIMGILLDNAAEASKEKEDCIIYWSISKDLSNYIITVRNTGVSVTYEEIASWFELGKTSKGEGRGIGLYRLKQICDEWKATILYSCKEIEEKEWILNIKKEKLII